MFNRQSGFNKDLSGLGAGAEKKNGMENENLSQADILYAKSKREDEEKKKYSMERTKLLNDIGNNLKPAQILYSTNEQLKKLKEEMEKSTKTYLGDKVDISSLFDNKNKKNNETDVNNKEADNSNNSNNKSLKKETPNNKKDRITDCFGRNNDIENVSDEEFELDRKGNNSKENKNNKDNNKIKDNEDNEDNKEEDNNTPNENSDGRNNLNYEDKKERMDKEKEENNKKKEDNKEDYNDNEDDKEENNDDFDEKDYWNDEEWEEYKKKQPRTEELGTPTGGASGVDDGKLKGKVKKDVKKDELDDGYGKQTKKPQRELSEEEKKERFEKEVWLRKREIDLATFPILGKDIARGKGYGVDAPNMVNLAARRPSPLYTKDAVKLKNFYDSQLDNYTEGTLEHKKEYMENKIKKQFKDFNYKMKDINGYLFKKNSAPVRRIKNSDSFEGFLKNNQEKIENGEDFTGRFLSREKGLFGAYGSVDFFNNGFDEEGNLHLFMFDTYDFNKGENALVEAGRRRMMSGKLKGFFTLHEITLSKDEYEKILNK